MVPGLLPRQETASEDQRTSSHSSVLATLVTCPMCRLEDDGDDDVAVLRPASAARAEVDEDFERDFAQLMLDYQGTRGGAGAAAVAGVGAAPAAPLAAAGDHGGAGSGDEGTMAFKVGRPALRC